MYLYLTLDNDYLLSFGKWYVLLEKRVAREDKWRTIFNWKIFHTN
jgi:hypothetical protein